MDASFDLDINNYTTDDLIEFFKLDPSYSPSDLTKREEELATEIVASTNANYTAKYKFDIISFIKSAKEVLMLFHKELETDREIKKNALRFLNRNRDVRTGKIINPLATHPALETATIPPDSINGYEYDVNTSIYVFNTAGRNEFFNTEPSNSTFDLPIKWKNVISISLTSANIPNVMYAFNDDARTNQIYIEEDNTGISGVITLPVGNYAPYALPAVVIPILGTLTEASFPDELTKEINEQLGIFPYRFKVEISLSTRRTTISNNTHTFRMNTIKKDPLNRNCTELQSKVVYSNNVYTEYGDPPPDKRELPFAVYALTMGYLMGFREVYYKDLKSYTSESVFTSTYSNYLFFQLEDYTGSQPASSTYGILGGSLLNKDILGIIPISSNLFSTTFDNNSNFIYKKREYYGPVDISRITIKLLNQRGHIVDLHKTDFNFSLQVRSIYNVTNHGRGLRTPGFL
jgi:hypothetical protein